MNYYNYLIIPIEKYVDTEIEHVYYQVIVGAGIYEFYDEFEALEFVSKCKKAA